MEFGVGSGLGDFVDDAEFVGVGFQEFVAGVGVARDELGGEWEGGGEGEEEALHLV